MHLWKNHVEEVINIINARHNKSSYRSFNTILKTYYGETDDTLLPQRLFKLYKFDIGDRVFIQLTPKIRRSFDFKYSLLPGRIISQNTNNGEL